MNYELQRKKEEKRQQRRKQAKFFIWSGNIKSLWLFDKRWGFSRFTNRCGFCLLRKTMNRRKPGSFLLLCWIWDYKIIIKKIASEASLSLFQMGHFWTWNSSLPEAATSFTVHPGGENEFHKLHHWSQRGYKAKNSDWKDARYPDLGHNHNLDYAAEFCCNCGNLHNQEASPASKLFNMFTSCDWSPRCCSCHALEHHLHNDR